MFSLWIVAQQGPPEANLITTLFPLLMIFGIFWFLVWRPQANQQKKHKEFLSALKVGDDVITGGGIFGKITAIEDDAIQVEISRGTKVRVLRQNIQGAQPGSAPVAASDDKAAEKTADKPDKKEKRDKKDKKEAKEGGGF
ncbi:MAG: preprotein translocase subunit YajC [Bradymonadaceae bacterium]|nr:preprotein translocase subunit YajC [Lujinxingiaceae bacterium]